MREAVIRKKAIEELNNNGWSCWYPYKSQWAKESDIFGVYDLICVHHDYRDPLFIQLTTLSNVSARRKKVKTFLDQTRVDLRSEIWGWDAKNKNFRKIRL